MANRSLDSKSKDWCPLVGEPISSLLLRFQANYPIEEWKTEGFFKEDDLFEINCYWLQFNPMPVTNHFLLGVIFIIIFVVGSASNSTVIYILSSCRHMRTPPNLLILNLATSDLLMVTKIPVFIFNCFFRGPALGKLGCEIYGFVSGLSGTLSIMTLAAIAIDRYFVLVNPLSMARKTTHRKAIVTIALLWIYSGFFASLPLVGVGKYVPEGYLTSCSFDYLSEDATDRVFIFSFFIAAWLLPFTILAFCYISIVASVSSMRKDLASHKNSSSSRSTSVASRKDHLELVIAKIVISLVFIWLLAWTPYAIVSLIGISGHGAFLSPTATMLPALFAKTSACINPFVYSLTHPKIKKELLSRLRCFNTSVSTNNSLTDTPIVHFRSRSYSRNPDANELEMQKNPILYHPRGESNPPATSNGSIQMRSKLLQQAAAEEERPPVDFTHLQFLGQYSPVMDQLIRKPTKYHSDSQLTQSSNTTARAHFKQSIPSTSV